MTGEARQEPTRDSGPSDAVKRRALLVLGMHRSGTSAVAGLMVRLGAAAPVTLIPPDAANPAGYWESEAIVACHDRLLRSARTSWTSWTPLDPSWVGSTPSRAFAADLAGLVQSEFGNAPLFVVKDPRMCRLGTFWLHHVFAAPIEPAAVLVLRDPAEVAASLAARDHLPEAFSVLMWLRHVLDAERATRAIPRSIVEYCTVLADWHRVARTVADDLRIEWPVAPHAAAASIEQFIATGTRNHTARLQDLDLPSPLGEWAARCSNACAALAGPEGSSHQEAFDTLDEIRSRLDAAASAFGRGEEIVRHGLWERLDRADADLRALQVERTALRARVVADEKPLDFRSHLERRIEALDRERAALAEEIDGLKRRDRELEHDLASARHHVGALLASGSWRVTAPLRGLARLARRVTGGRARGRG